MFLGTSIITSCCLFRFVSLEIMSDTLFKISVGALIAFLMEFTEVMVVTYTSSLTLSIAGVFKVSIDCLNANKYPGINHIYLKFNVVNNSWCYKHKNYV